jgi:superfamily I DNA and/or RNA helicase
MSYFKQLGYLLSLEKDADKKSYQQLTHALSVNERRENGMSWYPIAIRDTEIGRGDYLTIEVERTTNQDLVHQFRFGMTVALFSNFDPKNDRVEGTLSHLSGNRMKINLRTDELPEWSRNGKLGIDIVFDENSYAEMENALKQAEASKEINWIVEGLTTFKERKQTASSEKLRIFHGPPGTGKTTRLVKEIKAIIKEKNQRVLVTAPSNAAVDLLSERLAAQGLNVVRVGNPAKVNEQQLALTLDAKMSQHNSMKEIRRLRKQAAEFRDMAQKYKRSFGRDEREQRKALFTEAKKIMKEVEQTEQYIAEDILSKAQVITATLVGANHYSVRHLRYETIVIDEAAQALEPACWIPILKGQNILLAGDHCQLPPTIKSPDAAKQGLETTLMEKLVEAFPSNVTLLTEQYRMNKVIMGFSSMEFYENKLTAHATVADHLIFENDDPLLFIDTAGTGYEEKVEGTGISNPEEADFLISQIEKLVNSLNENNTSSGPVTIGVISPYRHQVELLKEKVRQSELLSGYAGLTVNTIDSFQGQERDVIFISMTRSNTDNMIGFLSELRRMNVAMTRAKKKLVVVGDSGTLSQNKFYADFIQYAEQNNGYKSAWEFM